MTASGLTPRERDLSLILAVLGLVSAIAFFAAFAANGFDRRAIHWGRVQVYLVWVLPLLAGLVMLAIRRVRDAGIAYAAGIGTVAVLALAPPLGLMFLMFLLIATPEQRVDAVGMFGYLLSMLAVALAAWTSFFRLPADRRRRAVIVATLIGAACYAFLAWWFTEYRMKQPYDRAALIREYNDGQARATIKSIAECARRQGESGRGVPAGMAELHAAGCLPKKLERGVTNTAAGADGYGFYYFADPPDASGKAARFALCARPSREDVGTLTIGIDPEGRVNELQATVRKAYRKFKPPFSPCATISPARQAVNRAVFAENSPSRVDSPGPASTRIASRPGTPSASRKRRPRRIVSPVCGTVLVLSIRPPGRGPAAAPGSAAALSQASPGA